MAISQQLGKACQGLNCVFSRRQRGGDVLVALQLEQIVGSNGCDDGARSGGVPDEFNLEGFAAAVCEYDRSRFASLQAVFRQITQQCNDI
jgi:hypothetical protein